MIAMMSMLEMNLKRQRDEDEMGVDVGLHAEEKPQCKANQQQTRQGIS